MAVSSLCLNNPHITCSRVRQSLSTTPHSPPSRPNPMIVGACRPISHILKFPILQFPGNPLSSRQIWDIPLRVYSFMSRCTPPPDEWCLCHIWTWIRQVEVDLFSQQKMHFPADIFNEPDQLFICTSTGTSCGAQDSLPSVLWGHFPYGVFTSLSVKVLINYLTVKALCYT